MNLSLTFCKTPIQSLDFKQYEKENDKKEDHNHSTWFRQKESKVKLDAFSNTALPG